MAHNIHSYAFYKRGIQGGAFISFKDENWGTLYNFGKTLEVGMPITIMGCIQFASKQVTNMGGAKNNRLQIRVAGGAEYAEITTRHKMFSKFSELAGEEKWDQGSEPFLIHSKVKNTTDDIVLEARFDNLDDLIDTEIYQACQGGDDTKTLGHSYAILLIRGEAP